MVSRIDLNVERGRETLAFVLLNVFNEQECKEWIQLTEQKGYEAALLNIGGGKQIYEPDVRNNDRCIIDDEVLAAKMFERIKEHIPKTYDGCEVVGLNERLRFLRYDPGHSFKMHMDGTFVRDKSFGPKRGERSIQIYLNEGFEGGATTFFDEPDDMEKAVPVVPKIGSVLVFQHDMWHEGSMLVSGRKYCVRTDVMYKPPPFIGRRPQSEQ